MTNSKQDQLLPVYLIKGEDELKRRAVLKRLKARIEALGDISFNYDVLKADSVSGTEIVAACNTMPFASELRLVQVMNCDSLKKGDLNPLLDYLEKPSPTTVLALVADKMAKNTKLYQAVQAIGSKAIIDCTPKKRYELGKTLSSIAAGYGIRITEGAAEKLISLVGENTIYLDNEIKKISLAHRGNDAVTEHEVSSLVSRTAEVKPWEFVDAFAARNFDKTFIYLRQMASTSSYALIAMCVSRLRELICARSLLERGNVQALATTLKMPEWRVKNHVIWARKYTNAELRNAIISSRDTERKMKSGSDPLEVFTEWVLAVMKESS